MATPFPPTALPPAARRTRRWYTQMALINFVEFVGESPRGIVLPTLFLYNQSLGGDLASMGVLTSVFSVGRHIASMVFGWMCDRYSFKSVYIVSLVICLLGNIIYMAADASATNSLAVLVVSRFIVGFGGGSRSVCRANVAALTTVDQRLKYITILAAVVFLGYALTPGLGSLVARTDMEVGGVQFNKFTSPGAILVALNIVTLVAIVFVFDDSVSIVDCPEETSAQSDQRQQRSATTREPVVVGERAIAIGAVLFIFLNFTAKGTLAVFETVNIPLYFQVTHSDPASNDTVVEASNFQFYLGLLGLITYVSIDILRDKITAIQWVYIGFTTLLVGNVMLVIAPSSLTYWRLVIAETFVWSVGCPITTAVVVAAFSRLLGTRPQGFLMGLLGSAGSMARITLPLLPAALPSMTAVFGFNIAFCVLGMSCLLCYARIAFRSAAQAGLERDLEKAPVKLTISDDSDSGRTTDSEDGLPASNTQTATDVGIRSEHRQS